MIPIANCFNLPDALRLKMVLDAANIPPFIPDENTTGAQKLILAEKLDF